MDPQGELLAASLIHLFEKDRARQSNALEKLCAWAVEDAGSLQVLLDSIGFLYQCFGLHKGRLENRLDGSKHGELVVWVLSECCAQVAGAEIERSLHEALSFVRDHPERVELGPASHPVLLRGNAVVLGRLCESTLAAALLPHVPRLRVFFGALWRLNERYGDAKWYAMASLLLALLLDRPLHAFAQASGNAKIVNAVQSWKTALAFVLLDEWSPDILTSTGAVLSGTTEPARTRLRAKVFDVAQQPMVRNLGLSRRPFSREVSEFLDRNWTSVRGYLDELSLLPGIEFSNPILGQFLTKKAEKSRTVRARSITSPKSLFAWKPRPLGSSSGGIGILGSSGARAKFVATFLAQQKKMVESLHVVQTVIWSHGSYAALSGRDTEGPSGREPMAELTDSIKEICTAHETLVAALASKAASIKGQLTNFALHTKVYLEYGGTLDRFSETLMSLALSPELDEFIFRTAQGSALQGMLLVEMLLFPLVEVLPGTLLALEAAKEFECVDAVVILSERIRELQPHRFDVFSLSEWFGPSLKVVGPSTKVLAVFAVQVVRVEAMEMHTHDAVLYVLGQGRLLCGRPHSIKTGKVRTKYECVFQTREPFVLEDIPDSKGFAFCCFRFVTLVADVALSDAFSLGISGYPKKFILHTARKEEIIKLLAAKPA
jgi:hypothetical protein